MGDQKYLNFIPNLFNNVYEVEEQGYGVAPWNLKKYKLSELKDNSFKLRDVLNDEEFELVFYHFQNIRYINKNLVNIKSLTKDKELKYCIYIPYLIEIEKMRDVLKENYDIDLRDFKVKRSSNILLSFLQKHFAALKVRSLSDIINLKKLESYL